MTRQIQIHGFYQNHGKQFRKNDTHQDAGDKGGHIHREVFQNKLTHNPALS